MSILSFLSWKRLSVHAPPESGILKSFCPNDVVLWRHMTAWHHAVMSYDVLNYKDTHTHTYGTDSITSTTDVGGKNGVDCAGKPMRLTGPISWLLIGIYDISEIWWLLVGLCAFFCPPYLSEGFDRSLHSNISWRRLIIKIHVLVWIKFKFMEPVGLL